MRIPQSANNSVKVGLAHHAASVNFQLSYLHRPLLHLFSGYILKYLITPQQIILSLYEEDNKIKHRLSDMRQPSIVSVKMDSAS